MTACCLQKASISERKQKSFLFCNSKNFTPTSHRPHIDFNAFFYLYRIKGEKPSKQGGNDYVFRFGMVLVAGDLGVTGDLCPVQGEVYEVVE